MKKHLLIASLALLGGHAAMCQLTLTKNLPPVGSQFTLIQKANTTLARPESGVNVTWDYSAVDPGTSGYDYEIIPLTAVKQSFQDTLPTTKYIEVMNLGGAPTPDHRPMDFYEDKGDYLIRIGQKGSNLNLEKRNDTMFVFNQPFDSVMQYRGTKNHFAGIGKFKIGSAIYDSVVMFKSAMGTDSGYQFFRIYPFFSRLAAIQFNAGVSAGIAYYLPKPPAPNGLSEGFSLHTALYPNPTRSQATLILSRKSAEVQISIVDLTGREIRSLTATDKTEVALDLSGMVPGSYLVQVVADGLSASQKLIVQ